MPGHAWGSTVHRTDKRGGLLVAILIAVATTIHVGHVQAADKSFFYSVLGDERYWTSRSKAQLAGMARSYEHTGRVPHFVAVRVRGATRLHEVKPSLQSWFVLTSKLGRLDRFAIEFTTPLSRNLTIALRGFVLGATGFEPVTSCL